MSGSTPPEVDPLDFSQIYGLQEQSSNKRTQSNGSSFGGFYDEPRRSQQAHPHRQGSGSSLGQSYRDGFQQSSEHSRKNSYPLEPSTMIATAPGPGAHLDKNAASLGGPSTYMGFGDGQVGLQQGFPYTDPVEQYVNYDNNGMGQSSHQQHQQQSQQTPAYQAYNPTYQPFDTPNNYASTSNQQMFTPTWGDQFIDSNNFQPTPDQQSGNYASGSSGQNGAGGEMSFDAGIAELIRSANASREPTPQPEEQSQAHSRSVSPFQPTINHYTPARNSSPFNKTTSPPALIIPGGSTPSPAPHLPPIITNPNSSPAPTPGNQPAPANSGGLFPPANPALSGMAGISPIHPTADGPMIFVQPSTPISGLTGARGIWENALRAAAEKRQDGKAGPSGNGAPHGLSRGNSNEDTRNNGNTNLDPPVSPMRPRAKSDSHMAEFDKQILMHMMAQQQALFQQQQQQLAQAQAHAQGVQMAGQGSQDGGDALSNLSIDAWRTMVNSAELPPTVDPRQLPGQQNNQFQQQRQSMPSFDPTTDANAFFQQMQQQHQLSQLQAQAHAHAVKGRLTPLNTAPDLSSLPSQATGFSPTSLAFYQSLGINPLSAGQLAGTSSAPFYQTSFQDIPQNYMMPSTSLGGSSLLEAPEMGPRRRSYAEGTHHASGAGTPGYGVGLSAGPISHGRPLSGHRRGIQSEDFGRGWGLGQAGSTSDFLQSITANDGSLLPPSRGRSHSRHSSASSARSASPALSISSQGSSMSYNSPRMAMPDEQEVVGGKAAKMPRLKVTSMATEMASSARRTNDGVFVCPIPGCGSTFTRHFNLKGHLRSHNDERPYKCLYDGCPKSVIGFARQHDCKRHMLLHEGLRPFECEGCGKKFARLDALTRHHKSEQGQECAISHPLPTNMDGSAMSESQYKAYKGISDEVKPNVGGKGKKKGRASGGSASGSGVRVKQEYEDHSGVSDMGEEGGMSEYDVAA